MGRKAAQVDGEKVRQYALLGLKTTEIAGMFGCDEKVIRRRFKKEVLSGKAQRVAAIRKAQYDAMLALNPTILIWLGKNELGQTDKSVVEHTGAEGGPIRVDLSKLTTEELNVIRNIRSRFAEPASN